MRFFMILFVTVLGIACSNQTSENVRTIAGGEDADKKVDEVGPGHIPNADPNNPLALLNGPDLSGNDIDSLAPGQSLGLAFAVPKDVDAKQVRYQCQIKRRGGGEAKWVFCDGADGSKTTVKIDSRIANAAGFYELKVRAVLDGSKYSKENVWSFYVHGELGTAATCRSKYSAQDFMKAALKSRRLLSVHKFDQKQQNLRGPFIDVGFASGQISAISLRRRFVQRTVDGVELIAMYRRFASRANGNCTNSIEIGRPAQRYQCLAIVFNASGKGACIVEGSDGLSIAKTIKSMPNKMSRSSANKIFSKKSRVGDKVIYVDPKF